MARENAARIEAERIAAEQGAAEKAAAEQAAAESAMAEKAAVAKRLVAEQAAAIVAAAAKAAAARATGESAVSVQHAAAEKAVADKLAIDIAAEESMDAEKQAWDDAAAIVEAAWLAAKGAVSDEATAVAAAMVGEVQPASVGVSQAAGTAVGAMTATVPEMIEAVVTTVDVEANRCEAGDLSEGEQFVPEEDEQGVTTQGDSLMLAKMRRQRSFDGGPVLSPSVHSLKAATSQQEVIDEDGTSDDSDLADSASMCSHGVGHELYGDMHGEEDWESGDEDGDEGEEEEQEGEEDSGDEEVDGSSWHGEQSGYDLEMEAFLAVEEAQREQLEQERGAEQAAIEAAGEREAAFAAAEMASASALATANAVVEALAMWTTPHITQQDEEDEEEEDEEEEDEEEEEEEEEEKEEVEAGTWQDNEVAVGFPYEYDMGQRRIIEDENFAATHFETASGDIEDTAPVAAPRYLVDDASWMHEHAAHSQSSLPASQGVSSAHPLQPIVQEEWEVQATLQAAEDVSTELSSPLGSSHDRSHSLSEGLDRGQAQSDGRPSSPPSEMGQIRSSSPESDNESLSSSSDESSLSDASASHRRAPRTVTAEAWAAAAGDNLAASLGLMRRAQARRQRASTQVTLGFQTVYLSRVLLTWTCRAGLPTAVAKSELIFRNAGMRVMLCKLRLGALETASAQMAIELAQRHFAVTALTEAFRSILRGSLMRRLNTESVALQLTIEDSVPRFRLRSAWKSWVQNVAERASLSVNHALAVDHQRRVAWCKLRLQLQTPPNWVAQLITSVLRRWERRSQQLAFHSQLTADACAQYRVSHALQALRRLNAYAHARMRSTDARDLVRRLWLLRWVAHRPSPDGRRAISKNHEVGEGTQRQVRMGMCFRRFRRRCTTRGISLASAMASTERAFLTHLSRCLGRWRVFAAARLSLWSPDASVAEQRAIRQLISAALALWRRRVLPFGQLSNADAVRTADAGGQGHRWWERVAEVRQLKVVWESWRLGGILRVNARALAELARKHLHRATCARMRTWLVRINRHHRLLLLATLYELRFSRRRVIRAWRSHLLASVHVPLHTTPFERRLRSAWLPMGSGGASHHLPTAGLLPRADLFDRDAFVTPPRQSTGKSGTHSTPSISRDGGGGARGALAVPNSRASPLAGSLVLSLPQPGTASFRGGRLSSPTAALHASPLPNARERVASRQASTLFQRASERKERITRRSWSPMASAAASPAAAGVSSPRGSTPRASPLSHVTSTPPLPSRPRAVPLAL